MAISSVPVRQFREDRCDRATRSAPVCVEIDNGMLVRHQEGVQLAGTGGFGDFGRGVGNPSMKGEKMLLGVESQVSIYAHVSFVRAAQWSFRVTHTLAIMKTANAQNI